MTPATAVVLGYIWGAASIVIAVSFGHAMRRGRQAEDRWDELYEEQYLYRCTMDGRPVHHYVSRN